MRFWWSLKLKLRHRLGRLAQWAGWREWFVVEVYYRGGRGGLVRHWGVDSVHPNWHEANHRRHQFSFENAWNETRVRKVWLPIIT